MGCRLTIRPSRRRFAARLNSGVSAHLRLFCARPIEKLLVAAKIVMLPVEWDTPIRQKLAQSRARLVNLQLVEIEELRLE